MKNKTVCRRVCPAVVLFLLLCAFCMPSALAAGGENIRIKIIDAGPSSLSYRVESDGTYQNALALTATYYNGRLCETKWDAFNVEGGVYQSSQSFSKTFNDFKVILLDGYTFTPICTYAGTRQVRFLDHDGTLLSEQSVLSGQAAVPPVSPVREGFIFTGWEGDYEEIYADREITAKYVADDAMNVFTISSASGKAGDEVTVSVALTGTVQVCGYDMKLLYDSEALEFVSLDAELSMDVVANPIPDSGSIKFNFGSTKNRSTSGSVMDITFRIKDSGSASAKLTLEPRSVICVDPDDSDRFLNVEHTACEGVIFVE